MLGARIILIPRSGRLYLVYLLKYVRVNVRDFRTAFITTYLRTERREVLQGLSVISVKNAEAAGAEQVFPGRIVISDSTVRLAGRQWSVSRNRICQDEDSYRNPSWTGRIFNDKLCTSLYCIG
jgi:hypothetical protein